MLSNFKRITVFRMIALFGALLMIIGIFPSYICYPDDLSDGYIVYSLFKILPIGAVVVLISSLAIFVGVGFANKIVSLVSAALGLISNIGITFVIKTVDFYLKITGTAEEVESIENLAGILGDEYSESVQAELNETILSNTSLKIGFYLILLGAIIAVIAMVIDIIKGDRQIENKIENKLRGTANAISDAANSVMENTNNEYSGGSEISVPRVRFGAKQTPWNCKTCGNENAANSRFCVYCGQEKPLPKMCYNCATLLEDHMSFCPKCGCEYDEERAKEVFEKTSQKSTCKYCGTQLPSGAMFCGKCGKQQ